MSRNVDMTKPLEEQSREDIQYALDRGLITGEDRQVAADFLTGVVTIHAPELLSEAAEAEVVEVDSPDDESSAYDPADHNVTEVVAYCEDDEVSAEEVERIMEAEREGKDRSSLLSALEDLLEGDED